jgi:flagellar motor protein MotB
MAADELTFDTLDGEAFEVWPAFVDLLAATSLLFVTLVAVFIYVANARLGDSLTQRHRLVEALSSVEGANGLYSIRDDGQFVRVTVQADATFPLREWRLQSLREQGKLALDSIGSILQRQSIKSLYREVRILGHTDQIPFADSMTSNWELSAARAAVVARYLVDKGLDACKISAAGRGPFYPLALQDSTIRKLPINERMTKNRRIEIEIVPARAAGIPEGAPCFPEGDKWRLRAAR